MALSEFEIRRIEQVVEGFLARRRPPAQLRDRLDLGYRIEGQGVELFEIRPSPRDPGRTIESPIAKATYVKRTGTWKLYWQRADLKWHRYEPNPELDSIEAALRVVEADDHGCFFG